MLWFYLNKPIRYEIVNLSSIKRTTYTRDTYIHERGECHRWIKGKHKNKEEERCIGSISNNDIFSLASLGIIWMVKYSGGVF
jgi:hypothetical protein